MSEYTKIELEVAKQLSAMQELAIVQAAFTRNPSPAMRERLAAMLNLHDAFDDTIALLSARDDRNFAEEMMLTQAYLARETPADTMCARAAAERAVALADDEPARAAALADRGKAEVRLGETAAARATLERALRLDPSSKDACKRLAALDLSAGDPAAVLAMADALAAQGAAHARLFAARALAHARLGAIDTARAAMAFDDLHHAQRLAPPPGWASIHAFNTALADELLGHPGLRYERYGSASERTWRIDAPATREAPLVRLLLDQITGAITQHLDRVAKVDHPWVSARPAAAMLRSWCVITESQGFETWHVHQFGWLSGVYYVRVPDSIANGMDNGGCLAFGLPEDLAGDDNALAYGTHVVRPHDGLMLAFPSHTYHRTFPHGLSEKRICLAFDLRPN